MSYWNWECNVCNKEEKVVSKNKAFSGVIDHEERTGHKDFYIDEKINKDTKLQNGQYIFCKECRNTSTGNCIHYIESPKRDNLRVNYRNKYE